MEKSTLAIENGHTVSYSEYGNREGDAILVFHGGPGSKSKPAHAERFDLEKYRVVLFDQRGCGESAPLGELEFNTTDDLLNDAERIREILGIENWFVSGSSWGGTLALLYAIKFPEYVQGLLVGSIYFTDNESSKWAMLSATGAANLMPDVWDRRMKFFQKFNVQVESQHSDLLKLLLEGDVERQKEITAGVLNWEYNLVSPDIAIHFAEPEDVSESDINYARIFLHYESNNAFTPDNYILNNAEKISHLPAVIVHGRYDILCPLAKTYELSTKLPKSELIIAQSSGHKLSPEGETIKRIAFERFLDRHAN